jgi:UDP-N-acetylmuramoylalanine--D-glutamate ligase
MHIKKVLICGQGVSGNSMAKFLRSQNTEAIIYDENSSNTEYTNLPNFNNIDAVYISPGFFSSLLKPHKIFDLIARYCIPFISDLDLLYSWSYDSKFIGITGTSGKTTTTKILAHLMKSAQLNIHMCGNMGINIFEKADCYVIEVDALKSFYSSNICFNYGVITNLHEDHQDTFYFKEAYRLGKFNILRQCANRQQKYYLGNGVPDIEHIDLLDFQLLSEDMVPPFLRQKHNILNVSMAYSILKDMNFNYDILSSLDTFVIDKYRQEIIYQDDNLLIVNDSKSTNLASLKAALDNYENIYLIMGGYYKNNDFSSFNIDFYKHKIKKIFLIGESKYSFLHLLKENFDCEIVENFIDLKKLLKNINTGCVLFSPACASFDMFNNYVHRGEEFNKLFDSIILSQNSF